MKATLTKQVSNARQPYNKETISSRTVAALAKGRIHTPVMASCYMGRSSQASVVYACVWISDRSFHTSGRGQAGGGGYHKESAAVSAALDSAGVVLDESIDGVGDRAIDEALLAVTRALGFRGQMEVIHG